MAVRTAYAPVAASVLTAANLAKLPGGWIGYVETTTAQTGITTTFVDLTSMTLSVTVGTGRKIKVTGQAVCIARLGAATITAAIREGSTTLNSVVVSGVLNERRLLTVTAVIDAPSAGAHTYKMSLKTDANNVDTEAAAGEVVMLLVEDIGATP